MKRVYPISMLLAMITAALSLTACGDDNLLDNLTDELYGLYIDDVKHYDVIEASHIIQTHGEGMYMEANVSPDKFPLNAQVIRIHFYPSAVADLREGQVLDYKQLKLKEYRPVTYIELGECPWVLAGGSIVITKITPKELTVMFDNLLVQRKSNGYTHTVRGLLVLNSGAYWCDTGEYLTFEEYLQQHEY